MCFGRLFISLTTYITFSFVFISLAKLFMLLVLFIWWKRHARQSTSVLRRQVASANKFSSGSLRSWNTDTVIFTARPSIVLLRHRQVPLGKFISLDENVRGVRSFKIQICCLQVALIFFEHCDVSLWVKRLAQHGIILSYFTRTPTTMFYFSFISHLRAALFLTC